MELIKLKNKQAADEIEEVLYKEWVPISMFVTISISLLLVLLVSVVITTAYSTTNDSALTYSLCGVLIVFFTLIGWNYRGIEITITKEEIRVNYGLFNRKKISIDDLLSCEATEATFKKYLGFGVRIGTDSSLGFTTGFGNAIKLTTQDSRPFVFSTKNQQKIIERLLKLNENLVTV